MGSQMSEARGRLAVLLLLLAGLGAAVFAYRPPLGRNALDACLYYQIARHVAEGDGVTTSASLYHQGLRDLPSPSTIYPLWPLALGGAGRLIGLDNAATFCRDCSTCSTCSCSTS
jgi:hypothetical protein